MNPEDCERYKQKGHHCLICKDEKMEWEETENDTERMLCML